METFPPPMTDNLRPDVHRFPASRGAQEINAAEHEGKMAPSTGSRRAFRAYPARSVGIKVGGRWTPTYIKSDPAGIWCSSYWPGACWVLSDTDYSNQFQIFVGVTFRF